MVARPALGKHMTTLEVGDCLGTRDLLDGAVRIRGSRTLSVSEFSIHPQDLWVEIAALVTPEPPLPSHWVKPRVPSAVW